MRDIPMFTTENGVASLVLKNINYNGAAYIRLHDTSNQETFILECCDFCRTVGAQKIYVSGNVSPDRYPLYTQVIEMCAEKSAIPNTNTIVIPASNDTIEKWRQLYNDKMRAVPLASFVSQLDAEDMMKKGSAYFVYQDDVCIGLAVGLDGRIDGIASLVPGVGKDVLRALCGVLTENELSLEVASENKRAIALYQSFGFTIKKVLSEWYQVF